MNSIDRFNMMRTVDSSKFIFRQIVHQDGTHENDSEHMHACATYVMILDDLIPLEIDRYKVIQMLLIHDLVEVIYGDTWYLASKENKELKKINELATAEKIFENNPKFMDLWREYEERKTPESIIAKQIDIIQAVCTIILHRGITWQHTKVSQIEEMAFSEWIHDSKTPLGNFLKDIFNYAEEQNMFYVDEDL